MLSVLRSLITRVENLVLRMHLPRVHSIDAELRKLGLIRILAAAVVLIRTVGIFVGLQFYPNEFAQGGLLFLPATPVVLFEIGMLTAVLVGFCTPLSILAVFLTYPQMDMLVSTSTLGTPTFETLLFVLLLSGSGQSRSIDSHLLRDPDRSPVHRFVAWVYGFSGTPDKRRVEVAYGYGFLTFGLISLAAIFHHLADPHWLGGHTSRVLLANSYLSDFWRIARWSEEAVPAVAVYMSYVGIIGQTVFQLFMIPMAYHRRLVWGTILWGWVFILGSTFGIKISFLPFIEVLLWWAVFHPARSVEVPKVAQIPIRRPAAAFLSGCYAFGLALFVVSNMPLLRTAAEAVHVPTNRIAQVL